MIERIKQILGSSPTPEFEEDERYYHNHVESAFRVEKIDRENNTLHTVMDYMDGMTIAVDLELYERKLGNGTIYSLNEESDKA